MPVTTADIIHFIGKYAWPMLAGNPAAIKDANARSIFTGPVSAVRDRAERLAERA